MAKSSASHLSSTCRRAVTSERRPASRAARAQRHRRRVRRPPLAQSPDQLTLALGRDLPVVHFGGLDRRMAEVLAERLVILERHANRLPVTRQRMAKGMRIEIRNAGRLERLAEDRANGSRGPPPGSLEAVHLKPPVGTADDPRPREQRIVRPPKQHLLRCRTQPSKISRMSSPTGTK